MEKTYYLIKINNSFYGKENKTFGRILQISNSDIYTTMLLIEEIGYTTKQGAKKALKKLIKNYQYKINNYKIDAIILKR